MIEDWMYVARIAAEQCWCEPETSGTTMDTALAEAFARRLAGWINTAAQHSRNEDFYRDLLDQCAEHLKPEAFIRDDGTTCDEPLRLKIPELVAKLAREYRSPRFCPDCGTNQGNSAQGPNWVCWHCKGTGYEV